MIDTSGTTEDIRSKLVLLVTDLALVGHRIKEVSREAKRVSED